jgi:diaminopimelate epimerase
VNQLSLSKHEGAGNDFLVAVDPAGKVRLTPELARALCDRHLGVGADGVMVAGPGRTGADLSMVLRNADGGEAELSGNGMRCLAQAAVEAGLVRPPDFTVATLTGVRAVSYQPGERPGHGAARVEMGRVRLGEERPHALAGSRAREADVGNPHLVVIGGEDPSEIDVAEVGPRLEAHHQGGVNVEFVSWSGGDRLALRVWERGVGETLACGTGSCAAAAVARAWDLVGEHVLVDNPGGTLEVWLGPTEDDPVELAGPVRRVAEVQVDPVALLDGGK